MEGQQRRVLQLALRREVTTMFSNPDFQTQQATSASTEHVKALALSMGDPAGIGPEVLLKALHRLGAPACSPSKAEQIDTEPKLAARVFGDPEWLMQRANELGLGEVLQKASWIQWESACSVPRTLPQGVASAEGGACAVAAVLAAANAVIAGACRALVTAPLNKQAMHLAGFDYPGHTELLAELADQCPVRMMLEHQHLRTVLHSIHLSLRQALDALDRATRAKTKTFIGGPQPSCR
ncbi:MAG: 4-hydroxythreonine-4-phosphate dehydrogenase 2 [Pseudomonadota bacterium]